jgi:hypothetical protein
LIPKQFGYVFKAGFRTHDPNAPIRLLVQILCGEPRRRDFLSIQEFFGLGVLAPCCWFLADLCFLDLTSRPNV